GIVGGLMNRNGINVCLISTRWAASANPRRWRMPSSSCPARRQVSSPEPTSSLTEQPPCVFRTEREADLMYVLNDMPEQVDGRLLDLLSQCRTETIGHHRHWGFVHGSIRSMLPGRRVVGTAVTVALPGHDSGMLSHALSL